MATFELDYNATGAARKELVKAISEITGAKAKYLGMPTAAYEVDYFTINKTGSVLFDDRADSEEIENLIEQLAQRGFVAEYGDTYAEQPHITEPEPVEDCPPAYDTPEPAEKHTDEEPTGLCISLPLDKVNVGNLTCLLEAKGKLIRKALGIITTAFEINEDSISFPWWDTIPSPEEVNAYSRFIGKLCAMTTTQKRISRTEKEVDNEKYAFRCFLLRLGFIGDEYKAGRKILLRNLTGSSAFKSGSPKGKEADGDAVSE